MATEEGDGARAQRRLKILRLVAVRAFVDAYDAWAQTEQGCGGPLFDDMVEARQLLEEVDNGEWKHAS